MQKYLLPIVALFLFQNSNSQKFNLGKISIKELEEKVHPLDSSAAASVLYNKAKTHFVYSERKGFTAVHEFEIRIKIYKKEGLDYANYEVPYRIFYENLDPDILTVSDAVTYNLVNGKIEKTKLTDDGKFKEKVNKYWRTITIALPNVKVGSVIEFKYIHKTENILSFPTFVFQKGIPVNFAEYRTEIPIYYRYKSVVKGFLKPETKNDVENAYQSTVVSAGHAQERVMLDYKQIISTHTLKDIPALKKEVYIDNIDNYRSSIDYELEVIKKPDAADKNFSKTWEGVAKTIFENEDFGKQLKQWDYFDTELRQLLQGVESREDKIKVIFNHVKTKMNWNNRVGIYADKGVKSAFTERTGNAAEINFILISMLNASGVMARPVLLSTIDNGIAQFPNQTAFNYVVALTELNGKPLLLDATHKYAANNVLPQYALNWSGRALDQHGNSEEINLAPETLSKYTANIMAEISKEGKISGKARVFRSDHEAFDWRKKNVGMNRENYIEKFENSLSQTQIKNYSIENEKISDQPILEAFDFESDNLVDVIGDKMYIQPLLFYANTKNPFSQEERKLPIYFGYPKQNKYSINLEIPEGYAIESIPESISLATGEDVGSFRYNVQASGKKIQITVITDINEMLVSQEFYPVLKNYFQRVSVKQGEKIILKKL